MDNGTELTVASEESARLSVPRFLSLVSPNMKRVDPKLRPLGESALQRMSSELTPATRAEFAQALLPSLALVAPSGMNDANREEWLNAAWIALHGIPLDLLKRGCIAARFSDHPAKIVPAILREIEEQWNRRRGNRSEIAAALDKMDDKPLAKEDRCTPEEAERIRKAAGIRYDDDGREKPANWIPVEQRTAPTREDYIRWGIAV